MFIDDVRNMFLGKGYSYIYIKDNRIISQYEMRAIGRIRFFSSFVDKFVCCVNEKIVFIYIESFG